MINSGVNQTDPNLHDVVVVWMRHCLFCVRSHAIRLALKSAGSAATGTMPRLPWLRWCVGRRDAVPALFGKLRITASTRCPAKPRVLPLGHSVCGIHFSEPVDEVIIPRRRGSFQIRTPPARNWGSRGSGDSPSSHHDTTVVSVTARSHRTC